ncbi:DMT family transporter [Paenibacillus contaminans]|uniref:EamA family transporter n=1 Tax=Paenibacillus contaminans TaxID=450362 RepID=A0A329MG80_9BACL|nr:DMT family transporter [Paenibacillus contaminans]RAV18874.1 EamA family transporter [Paenibacillus contaminans]
MWLAYAAAAAVCFGFRGILYQWTSRKPLDRNLMLFGVYLFGTIVALTTTLVTGQRWTDGTLIGLVMGLFSYGSNASMYKGFAVGKASLVAIFTALPPVVVIAGAYVLWHETLNFGQIIAFVVILTGILMIRYSNELSLSNLNGVQWAIFAMLGFAITDLASKQSTLWNAATFPTLTLMYGTGTLLFMGTWLRSLSKSSSAASRSDAKSGEQPDLSPSPTVAGSAAGEPASAAPEAAVSAWNETASTGGRDETDETEKAEINISALKQWSFRKTVLWGMFVGITNISGMMLLMPAFKHGITGLVSAIGAMSVVLILLYARLILRESFSRMEAAGAALAVVGVLVLRLLG